MASPKEPHKKAQLPQVHVVQELLPSVHGLLLLKEKMTANRVPFFQNVVPQPLQSTAGVVASGSEEREKVNGFEDERNGERKEESKKDRKGKKKRKKKLGSRSTAPSEQIPLPASPWLPETEDPWNNPSCGRLNTKEESRGNGSSPEKAFKLSPTRLKEMLHDSPTPPLYLSPQTQPPSPTASPTLPSPTKHTFTTNPTTASSIATNNLPSTTPFPEQTLSAPPSMGRSKSFSRALQLNTQTSPASPTQTQVSQQRARPAEKGRDAMSLQKSSTPKTPKSSVSGSSTHTISPRSTARSNNQDRRDSNPPTSTHPPTTTHLLKSATSIPSSTFPPVPLQTYFSLALASPTSQALPSSSFHSSQKPEPTQSTNTHNPPQHHPDDSAAIAFERITNFLILPGKLEGALWFGMLACLDSWLYMFTILPLRFLRALGVLCAFWWGGITSSLSWGSKTSRRNSSTGKSENSGKKDATPINTKIKREKRVSDLQPSHKADILRGLVVFTSCWILMRFDASRMYHSIRGQSGVKLYVIYNMLEVWTPIWNSLLFEMSRISSSPNL